MDHVVGTPAEKAWRSTTLSSAMSPTLLVLLLLLLLRLALAFLLAPLNSRNTRLHYDDLALIFGPLSPRLRPLPLPPPPVSSLPLVIPSNPL